MSEEDVEAAQNEFEPAKLESKLKKELCKSFDE